MLLGRDEFVSVLFSETDRAQRMRTPLALIAIEIDDGGFESGNDRFDEVVSKTVERIHSLLRCYDTIGRIARGKLAIVLPGCTTLNARTLAERVRDEVFSNPVTGCGTQHLNARYGVVSSAGRSPFVVLREVVAILRDAAADKAGAILCAGDEADQDFAAFLMPVLEPGSLRR